MFEFKCSGVCLAWQNVLSKHICRCIHIHIFNLYSKLRFSAFFEVES